MMLTRNYAVIRAVVFLLLQAGRPFAEPLSTGQASDEPAQRADLKNERLADLELMPSHELNRERLGIGAKPNSSFPLRSLVKRDSKDEQAERPEFLKSNGTLGKFGHSNNSTAPVPFKRHEVYTYIIYFSRVLYALVCIGKQLFLRLGVHKLILDSR